MISVIIKNEIEMEELKYATLSYERVAGNGISYFCKFRKLLVLSLAKRALEKCTIYIYEARIYVQYFIVLFCYFIGIIFVLLYRTLKLSDV